MQITLEIPDEIVQGKELNETEWLQEIAIALFQQELITLGRASRIARMHQVDFQKLLGSRGICIHYDLEDFEEDVRHLEERGWLRSL
jgi:predicted HTH domain antitoxin